MTAVKKLEPHEFTAKYEPIFLCIEQETGFVGRYNPKHFYPAWRRMMEIGVAHTWSTNDSILGAIFTPELFSGKIQVYVIFWFSLPTARGTGRPQELLTACEAAAIAAGAFKISSSAHINSTPARAAGACLKRGYEKTEDVYTKYLIPEGGDTAH